MARALRCPATDRPLKSSSSTIRTPAKLNLGLEVVGRRPGGYHEIRTIFQAVGIHDDLSFSPGGPFEYQTDPALLRSVDLVRAPMERAARRHNWSGTVRLHKRIPLAAGLGGGSSDVALALRLAALAAATESEIPAATRIGADVPFFLKGGTALASGVGEELQVLPTPDIWFVVHVPRVAIAHKTRVLFGGLAEIDFSAGLEVEALGAALARHPRSRRPSRPPGGSACAT